MTMQDKLIERLPMQIQEKIAYLKYYEFTGWSEEWQKNTMECMYLLNLERDKGNITKEEHEYIHKKYLKSVGISGENNKDFFNFFIEQFRY